MNYKSKSANKNERPVMVIKHNEYDPCPQQAYQAYHLGEET